MTKSFQDDDFDVITIPAATYELESFTNGIKRIFNEKGCSREGRYPIIFKPNFSSLGSMFVFKTILIGSQIASTPDDSI